MSRYNTHDEARSEYVEKMGADLGELFHTLSIELTWIHWRWKQYRTLFGDKESRIDLLNESAPFFFRTVQDVVFEDTLLAIARLVGPKKTMGHLNLTVLRLLELIEDPAQAERVKELTGGLGVDLVLDCVGADVWEENLLSLKQGGRLVITGVTSGTRTNMDLSVLHGRPLHLMGSGGRSQRTFVDMMKAVDHGALRGVVGRVFPLEEVSQAHQVMADRDFFGKLVIES